MNRLKTHVRARVGEVAQEGETFTNNDFIAPKNAACVRVMAVTQAIVGGVDP